MAFIGVARFGTPAGLQRDGFNDNGKGSNRVRSSFLSNSDEFGFFGVFPLFTPIIGLLVFLMFSYTPWRISILHGGSAGCAKIRLFWGGFKHLLPWPVTCICFSIVCSVLGR